MKSLKDPLFPLYRVNAFAKTPFTGNPAAVVFMMGKQSDAWMQAFAKEMNLSETAFFGKKGDRFTLRWFTPETEVDLCGHATLATAHVIWETNLRMPDEEIRFETKSGVLRAQKDRDWIKLDFPAEKVEEISITPEMEHAVGEKIIWAGANRMDYLFEVASEKTLLKLHPDMQALKALEKRGIIVTAKAVASKKYDFVSRFFGPAVGVDEDPVTGSAHCALAPYWSEKLGMTKMMGYQASARGGFVKVRNRGDRVELGGQAITIFQGVIAADAFGGK